MPLRRISIVVDGSLLDDAAEVVERVRNAVRAKQRVLLVAAAPYRNRNDEHDDMIDTTTTTTTILEAIQQNCLKGPEQQCYGRWSSSRKFLRS